MSRRGFSRGFRSLLIGSSIVLVAACSEVGPNYVRPTVRVPASYKEAPSQNLPRGVVGAGRWWEIYHDAVLDNLVSQVSVSNQSLAAAAARVREAQALTGVAGGARAPEVTAGTIKSGRKNQNDFGVGVGWEIDLWGRIRRDIEAHRASAQASADDLAAATLSMQAQVVQSYFALRQEDALLDLLQPSVAVDQQWQQVVQNQFSQGIVGSDSVADAASRLATLQVQLADARTTRAQLEHALAVMLGKSPADFSIAPAPFDTVAPEVPADLPANLLERRPDIAASERRVAAASAHIGVTKAQMLPSISLAAGIGIIKGPMATANIQGMLFDGGRLRAEVTNADAAYTEAVANYRQTVLDAFREVEDDLVAASALSSSAELQTTAAKAALESERVTRNQYREGVADFPALVSATTAALNAGQQNLQLRLRRLNTSVALIKALGGGWQDRAQREVNSGSAKKQLTTNTPVPADGAK